MVGASQLGDPILATLRSPLDGGGVKAAFLRRFDSGTVDSL